MEIDLAWFTVLYSLSVSYWMGKALGNIVVPCYSLIKHTLELHSMGIFANFGELRTNEDPIACFFVEFRHLALMFFALVG